MTLKKFILAPILFLPLLAIAGYSHKCDMNIEHANGEITVYSYQYNGTLCGVSNDYTVTYTIGDKELTQVVNGQCEIDFAECCQEA